VTHARRLLYPAYGLSQAHGSGQDDYSISLMKKSMFVWKGFALQSSAIKRITSSFQYDHRAVSIYLGTLKVTSGSIRDGLLK
jgi:hypothetical protein